MKKKLVILFEILLIIIGLLYYVIKIGIPEYKASLGSSDGFINSKNYYNMIEIVIDQKTDFGIMIDKEGKINHLFFFDSSSTFLYNKNIENMKLDKGLKKIIQILTDNSLLSDESSCEILRNNDEYYSNFMIVWKSLVSCNNIEKKISLSDRAKDFEIYEDSNSSILWNLDFYSKEIINNSKISKDSDFDNSKARKYADYVYNKLINIRDKKNITTMKKENVDINISLIPANEELTIYPTPESWYYIENGKVYAYIEFLRDGKSYSYCYKGTNDPTEGECINE